MTKQIRWTVVLVFMMMIVLVACGRGGETEDTAVPQATEAASEPENGAEPDQAETEPDSTDTPEPEPTDTPIPPTNTPEPTDTPEPKPTDTPKPVVAAPELDLTTLDRGLSLFDSYRLLVEITVVSADAANNAHMQINMANISEPPAASISLTAEGIEEFEAFGSLAMAQLDGVSYVAFPGLGCITNTEEGDLMDTFGENFLDTNEFTDKLDKARFVGEEVINDIEVLHYEIDSTMLEEDDDLDEIAGDVYVAKDGGYIVSMILDGTGPMDFLGGTEDDYGTMHLDYNLTDINESFEISLPEGCDASADQGGSEFPVTEDAYELSSFSGFTSYKSDLPFTDIVAFYETVLSEAGWTQVEADSFMAEDTAVLVYTRDEEKLNITIGSDDDDTQFVLMVSE